MSPRRLLARAFLRGYLPLALVVVVLLVVTAIAPSKIVRQGAADAVAQAAGVGAAVVPGGAAAGAPSAVARAADPAAAGAAGHPAAPAGATRALVPDAAHGRAVNTPAAVANGIRAGADCAGGTLQAAISPYSPSCVDFSGTNGGATSRGVSTSTITVAMRDSDMGSGDKKNNNSALAKKAREAGISSSPEAKKLTLDTLLAYFNKTYQTYGRTVKIVPYTGRGAQAAEFAGGGQEAANADALKVGQEIGAFADISATTQPYLDALVRQQVLAIGGLHLPASYYRSKAPYAWGQLIDCTTLMTSASDLLAKRFPAGTPAARAGSTALRQAPRKYALLVPDDPVYARCIAEAQPQLKAAGITFAKQIRYALDFSSMQQQAPNMAAQLKAAGITTVVLVTDPLLPYFLTAAATQQNFWPEWFVTGTIGTDADVAGQFYDNQQWQNAYGQSYLTGFNSGKGSEAYKAYKTLRQDEPTNMVDLVYQTLLMLFTGIEEAGPNLTPQTFQQGMFSWGPHLGAYGRWSFGPNDFTSVDDATEIYFDPRAISAFNSKPGRWVVLNGGKRFRGTGWPAKDPGAPIPPAAAP